MRSPVNQEYSVSLKTENMQFHTNIVPNHAFLSLTPHTYGMTVWRLCALFLDAGYLRSDKFSSLSAIILKFLPIRRLTLLPRK